MTTKLQRIWGKALDNVLDIEDRFGIELKERLGWLSAWGYLLAAGMCFWAFIFKQYQLDVFCAAAGIGWLTMGLKNDVKEQAKFEDAVDEFRSRRSEGGK